MLKPKSALAIFTSLALSVATVALLDLTQGVALAAAPIPTIPQYYVLDEPGVLTPQQESALSSILIEHDQAAGEQIVVAIFRSLQNEEAATRTREVFEAWQVGKRGRDNGALLALYAHENVGFIQAGYGLAALDESENTSVIRDFLAPELRAGHDYRAVGLSVLQMLRAIGSPLIESGRAQQLLQEGGLAGSFKPTQVSLASGAWLAFVLAGTVFFVGLLINILAAEAHFTGEGWFRPNPLKIFSLRAYLPGKGRRAPKPASIGGLDGRW